MNEQNPRTNTISAAICLIAIDDDMEKVNKLQAKNHNISIANCVQEIIVSLSEYFEVVIRLITMDGTVIVVR